MISHILGWLSVGFLTMRGAIYAVQELFRPPRDIPRVSEDVSDISRRHPELSRVYPMTTQAYRVHIADFGTYSQIYLETDPEGLDDLS